ncbi:MAG TPA: sigma factor, partial [Chthoniobacteraceae bacterium]|nr:sigma factor [Chthoniobacteraceae bacterium]
MSPDSGQLYDDHAQALFAFALNLTRSDAEARDALHDVFARISARPNLLNGIENARHFLLRLTHRAVIDAHRRSATRERVHL